MVRRAYLVLLVMAASCGARGKSSGDTVARAGTSRGAPDRPVTPQNQLLHLDLTSPTLTQWLGAQRDVRDAKFVEIEVVRVVNPKYFPVTIRVDYAQAPGRGQIAHLGSFSLYPVNNPGTFIVGTQDELRPDGAVILTLERPEKAQAADTLALWLRPLKFRLR
jgi:hypothetical protein